MKITQEEIETIEAGPELDALVAKALGFDVLGIALCVSDYAGGYDIPYEFYPGTIPRPVYLRKCCCEFREDEVLDYFGHFAGCLEVCKEYSLDDNFAFEIVDWLAEQGYSIMIETRSQSISYCQIYKSKDREFLAGFEECVGWGEGKTRPLAICRALLLFAPIFKETRKLEITS